MSRIKTEKGSFNKVSLNKVSLNKVSLNKVSLNKVSLNKVSLNKVSYIRKGMTQEESDEHRRIYQKERYHKMYKEQEEKKDKTARKRERERQSTNLKVTEFIVDYYHRYDIVLTTEQARRLIKKLPIEDDELPETTESNDE